MEKEITLELQDNETGDTHEFVFVVTTEKYDRLQNMLSGKDKVSPMHNFAVACIKPEQKQEFVAYLLANQGLAGQIAMFLVEEFLPKVQIAVKKPKSGLSTSN